MCNPDSIVYTPADEIRRRVSAASPLATGRVPANLAQRLGATHFDGKYFLTAEPYLVEGARKLHEFGFGVGKFWLSASMRGYSFNSDWPYSPPHPPAALDQIIRHPHYAQAFEFPFSTICLEVGPLGQGPFADGFDMAAHEREVYGVALYLLQTYRDRDLTFILQNWEGDWIYRGTFDEWPVGGQENISRRSQRMIEWFSARQRAVSNARKDAPGGRVRVLHAVEVNRPMDSLLGKPTLLTHVLPHARPDLVSWSAYDGLADEVSLWHGIELLRQSSGVPVYVGEIGYPEWDKTAEQAVAWWDKRIAALLALDVPYIVHWELYCNEPRDGIGRHEAMVRPQGVMSGYWLLRPDGSVSFAGEYFKRIMAMA
jgi:hypothetical protein